MKKYLNIYNNKFVGRSIGVRFNVGFNVGFTTSSGCSLPLHAGVAGGRFYHNQKFHRAISQLYKANGGRKFSPVPFDEKSIDGFSDLKNKLAVKDFFKKFIRKGGIYKFSLINKPNIFYIGSTGNFYTRFLKHTGPDALVYNFDWFHYIGQTCGWDKFNFEILEVWSSGSVGEDLKTLRDKENFYLRKYYPLLNSKHKSAIVIHRKTKLISKDGE